MEKILENLLSSDKTLLTRRDDLIKILEEKVPNHLARDYAPIKKALMLNVGELFFVGGGNDETVERVREILKSSGMQDHRIDHVINVFVGALQWDKKDEDISAQADDTPKQVELKKSVEPNQAAELKKSVEPNQAAELKKSAESKKSRSTAFVTPKVEESEMPAEVVAYNVSHETHSQKYVDTVNEDVTLDKTADEIEKGIITSVEESTQNNSVTPKNIVTPENVVTSEKNIVTPENVVTSNIDETYSAQNFDSLPENKPDSIFTMQGRLNRWRFLKKSLKLMVLSIIGAMLSPLGLILVLVAFIGNVCISVRRLHDLNKSGWFLLITFIPYVNFIFALYVLLAKGTDGVNKYGRDTLM